MKKKYFYLTFLFPATFFAQKGNVGINTVNPQILFHVDGGKDNPQTGNTLTAPQILNDAGVTSAGNVGVAVNPVVKLQLASRSTASSPQNEGILLPKLSRARAASMATNQNLTEGTMIYVNDISNGTQSGSTADMNLTGFFIWDKKNTTWKRLMKTEDDNGITVNKNLYTTTSNKGIEANEVKCGKFVLRISSGLIPQIKFQDNITPQAIHVSLEQRKASNIYSFQGKDISASAGWQNLRSSAMDPGEINIMYFNYPYDNLFKKVTFFNASNTAVLNDAARNFSINCEIE